MRSFFIAAAVFVVCGCAGSSRLEPYYPVYRNIRLDVRPATYRTPYFDLRHPIYIMADKSLWSGCAKDRAGYKACRASRIKDIYAGLNQWFEYFDKANRPRAVIVFSGKELPANLKNKVVRLRIEADNCGEYKPGKNYAGCYRREVPEIVFDHPSYIIPRLVAHEFGHTFGRGDNDVPEETHSVMSYGHPIDVSPLDMAMMCRLHYECQMVKRKDGKSYDPVLLPVGDDSASPGGADGS